MDPLEMIRLLQGGQATPQMPPMQTPAPPVLPPIQAEKKPNANADIMRELMSPSGMAMGRPDGMGGVNHQGRVWSAIGPEGLMKMASGGMGK